jgi:selenocysteine lyase/cysteine desulfurase
MGHERDIAHQLRKAVADVPGVTVLGPGTGVETLPVVSFTVDGVPPALVAARLSAEYAIGVRHGCFCAHPYLTRLLGLSSEAVQRFRSDVLAGDRRSIPGAVRVSACLSTTAADVQRLAGALAAVACGDPAPVPYDQDVATGDFHPAGGLPGAEGGSAVGAGCAVG